MEILTLVGYSLALFQVACVIVVAAYLITRSKSFIEVIDGRKSWKNQIFLMLFFGAVSVYGSALGIGVQGAILNVRDLGPLASGLVCGPLVGVGAGLIGAAFRLELGGFTAVPCAVAAVLAGLFGGLVYLYKRTFPGVLFSVAFAVIFEIFHMLLTLAIAKPFPLALEIVEASVVPMVLANAGGMLVFAYIFSNFIMERETRAEKDRLQRDLEREQAELEVAAEIQKSFLPEGVPILSGFELAASNVPAREVGGDFYDFLPADGKLGVVIADVAGKGVPAALFMALSRTILRACASPQKSASEVLKSANDMISSESRAGMFVTLFFGLLNPQTRNLDYANAGHFPPLLFQAKKSEFKKLDVTGAAIGIRAGLNYQQRQIDMQPGDILVLYTDGIIEALSSQEERFGRLRLCASIKSSSHLSAQGILNKIVYDVAQFSRDQEQFDDITAIVIKAM